MTAKAFTFDYGRVSPNSTISRIDKFLVSQELEAKGGRIEVAMSVQKFSNYSPFILTIWGQPASLDKVNHYFNLSFLGEEDSRAEMLMAWEGDPPRPIDVTDSTS
jgi:hypothetical protein